MLIKYASLFSFLLITVSCTSSSDDGAEVTVPFSQVGEALIKEALDTPEISSQFTSSSHVILSSIASINEFAMPFYDFAVQTYDFNYFGFDSEDPQSWNAFVNYPFRDFSRQEADQAQEIINKILLPSHPFLSQVPFTLHTAEFLNQMILDIDTYLDKVAKDIFIQQFSQILALEDPSEAQILLKDHIHKAKNTSFPDPEFKYHHAFLANVPFDYFKQINYCHPEHHNSINTFISQLAPVLYYKIAEDSKQLAGEILSGLLPSIYSTLTDTSYENTIVKYQESSLKPIDKSYLWDPQQFHGDLLEALQALTIVENHNLRPYLKMLEFLLSDDSPLNHLFNHYIIQNFCKPSDLSLQDEPLFWRSLIFSSFTVFSSIFRHHSVEILQQIYLLASLDEDESIFVYGLLDDLFLSKSHFPLVAYWGHASTVKLLLQSRTDISADHVKSALINAAEGGHTSTIDSLLQRSDDIPPNYIGSALRNAAKGGYTSTVKLLFQRRSNISANHASLALRFAAKGGHAITVDCILQHCTDISADQVRWALIEAAECGHTCVIDCILQRRDDISADHVGSALRNAAKGGHTPAVNFILMSRDDISADHVGLALMDAAKGGYTSTVDSLLQRSDGISAYHSSSALRYAAKSGHTSTVDSLFQRRTDISADHIKWSLIDAADGGHTSTVNCILQRRTDISADDVGWALRCAAAGGHTPAVNFILMSRDDISAGSVGWALCNATKGGHTSVVELLLEYGNDIDANHVRSALKDVARDGHRYIVDLLRQYILKLDP
jgi:hypothetical protein